MPFLTPNTPPDNFTVCRRIRIPAQTDWLSLVTGALAVLSKPYNFELAGTSTVEETTQFFSQMLTDYVDSGDYCMIGSIFPFMTAIAPPNCLVCDGAIYQRVLYPDLYAALDVTFILDDDYFYVPDLRGKMPLGAGDGGTDYTNHTVGEIGGEETHLLDVSELAAHSHNDTGHTHSYSPPGISIVVVAPGEAPVSAINLIGGFTGVGYAAIESTGDNVPHNNMPPFLALNYCVMAR